MVWKQGKLGALPLKVGETERDGGLWANLPDEVEVLLDVVMDALVLDGAGPATMVA